jgi:hypothetical protein
MKENNDSSFINKETKKYLSNKVLIKTLDNDFIPLALATTILSPLNRIKICLQNMNMISIAESEKVYKTRILAESKLNPNI